MTNMLEAEKRPIALEQSAALSNTTRQTLLCLGPAGGTLGGAVSLFRTMVDVFESTSNLQVEVIDTAPPPNNYQYKSRLINNETVNRTLRILTEYIRKISQADAVLFYANRDLALTVGPILASIARAQNTPFFLKTIAGDLAMGLAEARVPLRYYALKVMNSFSGILAETRLLQTELEELGYDKVYYVPNCRRDVDVSPAQLTPHRGHLKLVFISQINRQKGVFLILEAMRLLHTRGETGITCDFYGPIFDDIEEEFLRELALTPGVRYWGAIPVDQVLTTMAKYDVLILPTYHITEGHPGIIIEAMQIGIPVISSRLRAIPELITHNENGLLVEPENYVELADTISLLNNSPDIVIRMGKSNYVRRIDFSANRVVQDTVTLMLPSIA